MFRIAPPSIIRSFSLYTQQWYMSYRFAVSLGEQAVSKPVWHKPLLCVQWKTPDDGQRSCPKHVEFHFKNKFEKLVHLIGFIIRNEYTSPSIHGRKNEWTSAFISYVASCPVLILKNSMWLSGKEIVQSSTRHRINRFCDLNSPRTKQTKYYSTFCPCERKRCNLLVAIAWSIDKCAMVLLRGVNRSRQGADLYITELCKRTALLTVL